MWLQHSFLSLTSKRRYVASLLVLSYCTENAQFCLLPPPFHPRIHKHENNFENNSINLWQWILMQLGVIRLCKEVNHLPLKCNEVKSDAARLYLEEKMTEALVRKCYHCGRMFFKEEGCNKMTCLCGAQMCYVCDKPVLNYNHFSGQGGMRSDLWAFAKCKFFILAQIGVRQKKQNFLRFTSYHF